MKKILITGSKGNIGSAISTELAEYYKLTFADLPNVDVRDYNQISRIMKGQDAVIHLAWNSNTENFENGQIDPDNSLMFRNVYAAALKLKIPKVIMASSVHADDFRTYKGKNMPPDRTPLPTSPYGADKVFMEALGRYYSQKGLEVVCIRIGAFGEEKPERGKEGEIIWLTPNDCVSLVRSIINSKKIPDNFSVIYGISNNRRRIHDISNPFGWKPKEGC